MTKSHGMVEQFVDRFMPLSLRPFWEKLRNSNIGYRLAHGAFWSTVGAGVSQTLMLLTSVIIARILGREQFGKYGIILSTMGMFSVFASFGLGTTATKYIAEFKRTDPAKAGRIMGLSSLVAIAMGGMSSVVLFLIAPWLAVHILAAPQLAPYIRLGTGLIFLGAINGAQLGALAGFEAFRAIARINVLAGILSFPFVVICSYLFSLQGAVAGQVIVLAINCLINYIALRKETHRMGIPFSYRGCIAEKGVLLSVSLPAVLAGLMVSPVNWACAALLVNQTNGYAEMGIFNAANSWQKAILFLPYSISGIALPMLSELHQQKRRKEYLSALYYNIMVNGGAALLVAAGIALLSPFIMKSYGVGFAGGARVLVILCLTSTLIAVGTVVGSALVSANRIWFGFIFNMLWGLVLLGLAALLVPRFGALGLALAFLVAYMVHTVIQLLYVLKQRG